MVVAGRSSSPPRNTRNEPDMPRCISSTSPEDKSASRYLARRPSPMHGLAFDALHEILRQRPAQIAAPRLDLLEARALHDRRKAAPHGLDFGQFGHWQNVLTEGSAVLCCRESGDPGNSVNTRLRGNERWRGRNSTITIPAAAGRRQGARLRARAASPWSPRRRARRIRRACRPPPARGGRE